MGSFTTKIFVLSLPLHHHSEFHDHKICDFEKMKIIYIFSGKFEFRNSADVSLERSEKKWRCLIYDTYYIALNIENGF